MEVVFQYFLSTNGFDENIINVTTGSFLPGDKLGYFKETHFLKNRFSMPGFRTRVRNFPY